jgi:hypothetical protein
MNVSSQHLRRTVAGICIGAALLAGSFGPLGAAELPFTTHATFYSQQAKRATIVDPQVFVADETATASAGPQNVEHVGGFRPARLEDAQDTPIANAAGEPLGLSLGKWFAGRGSADIVTLPSGNDRITFTFSQLIAFGHYSLFELTFSPDGATFAPLDGDGSQNNFDANVDGNVTFAVSVPHHIEPGNAIVLVYHSDDVDHGVARGQIGQNAHQQLALRLPAAQ